MCVRRNTGDTLNERKRTAKKKSFKSEVSIMKEKEAQEAQEVLLEYYIQTTEDCRTVGNQKYQVLVSIAIALAGILYAAVRINDIQPSPILGLLVCIVIVLFIIIVVAAFWTLLFLWGHLPILDKIARKIEELQRDILFKKMGDKYLFCWDDIPGNDNDKIREFLVKNFNVKWVKNAKIEKKDNNKTIKLSTGNIFKKSLSLALNDEKTTATLTINKMIDEFDIKDEEKLKVFEPELKYRFREIFPHSNVYNQSLKLQIIVTFIIFSILLIMFLWYKLQY